MYMCVYVYIYIYIYMYHYNPKKKLFSHINIGMPVGICAPSIASARSVSQVWAKMSQRISELARTCGMGPKTMDGRGMKLVGG